MNYKNNKAEAFVSHIAGEYYCGAFKIFNEMLWNTIKQRQQTTDITQPTESSTPDLPEFQTQQIAWAVEQTSGEAPDSSEGPAIAGLTLVGGIAVALIVLHMIEKSKTK